MYDINSSKDDLDTASPTRGFKYSHVLLVVMIICCILTYYYRNKLAEAHDRYRTRRRMRYSLSSFEEDLEDGLSSNTFDIHSNISENDQRKGLSKAAKKSIKEIMNRKNISFDDARLEYTRETLDNNDIGEDGLPRDPKLVTFDR